MVSTVRQVKAEGCGTVSYGCILSRHVEVAVELGDMVWDGSRTGKSLRWG